MCRKLIMMKKKLKVRNHMNLTNLKRLRLEGKMRAHFLSSRGFHEKCDHH